MHLDGWLWTIFVHGSVAFRHGLQFAHLGVIIWNLVKLRCVIVGLVKLRRWGILGVVLRFLRLVLVALAFICVV